MQEKQIQALKLELENVSKRPVAGSEVAELIENGVGKTLENGGGGMHSVLEKKLSEMEDVVEEREAMNRSSTPNPSLDCSSNP